MIRTGGKRMKRTEGERPSLEEIRRILKERLPGLQKRYGVKSLGIFGSYIRGEQTSQSDPDILVEFDDCPLTLL